MEKFILIDKKEISELNSMAYLLEHKQTGARVLKLENDDDNKVFTIGFRTPPQDSTGVAHIVEHCVLSGSTKYRTKEPFMDLIKTSLQTFLNAMTYPDKTLYPIASRNDKDFYNLMDVYLDAVFNPLIYDRKEIFMQEGWHRELDSLEGEMSYKGVVYNEMRGAMSSADDQVYNLVGEFLYPDTTYKHNSGGNPYEIPNLSYEDFLDFHRNHYHPSNSYIVLYGNGDLEAELEHLETYLGDFDRIDPDTHIHSQPRFDEPVYAEEFYSTEDEIEGKKDYLAYALIAGDALEPKIDLTMSILISALVNSDAGEVKKALLDAGIGEDVYSFGYTIRDMPFGVIAKNTSADRRDDFVEIIENALKKVVEEGFDKNLLLSTINRMEYRLREAQEFPTRGIIYAINAFDSWLYGGSPFVSLEFDQLLIELREGAEGDYFERFIEERFLNNPHKVVLTVRPKKGLNLERDQALAQDLKAYKESLSQEELEEIIEANQALTKMQLTEDSEEDKATIPVLELSEIDDKLEEIPRLVEKSGNSTYLYHQIFTSGINYMNFAFDISHIEEDELFYLGLLNNLLGYVDTEERGYEELIVKANLVSGGVSSCINNFGDAKEAGVFYPKLVFSTKVIGDQLDQAVDVVKEIVTQSVFEDEKRFTTLLEEMASRIEMSIFSMGSAVVSNRAKSFFEKAAKHTEYISGLDFFWMLQDLVKKEDKGEDLRKIRELYAKVFSADRLILNFTGSLEGYENFKEATKGLLEDLPMLEIASVDYDFKSEIKSEGIGSSAGVQYVGKAASLKSLDQAYSGKMRVLANLVSREYLHNNIRAKGGAYGTGLSINKNSLSVFSYRDPNLVETIDVYKGMGASLLERNISQENLNQVIIGSMNAFDPPYTPSQKGYVDMSRYISGLSLEEVERRMKEALDTKPEDIRAYANMLEKAMEEDYLVVLGNKAKIEENSQLFDSIKSLKK